MLNFVLVFCPLGEPVHTSVADTMTLPFTGNRLEVVGFLQDYPCDIDADDYRKVSKDLMAFGIKAELVARHVKFKDLTVGASISIGVFVEDYQQAEALPSFVPLFHASTSFIKGWG